MTSSSRPLVVVIGAGPAGLMAAEVLMHQRLAVHVMDSMPSVGRKFLLAGKGGLNLTHAEPQDKFLQRYGVQQQAMEPWLKNFGADQVVQWAQGLGVPTFVGSSGHVFPKDMKAAPLLRAWLHRLRAAGVQFHMRHRWLGWEPGDDKQLLRLMTPKGQVQMRADAVVLALGGASWSRLGSDGAWVSWLRAEKVPVAPLQPSNCGFDVEEWSTLFKTKFAGLPFKSVAMTFSNAQGVRFERKGEFVATATGVEGSLIYAASQLLRDEISDKGEATIYLDLLPGMTAQRVLAEVAHPRGARSLSSHLQSRLKLDGIKRAVLYELLSKETMAQPELLAAAIKALPIKLVAPRPVDEAISTAGGVLIEAMDEHLMLKQHPGVFCAGEMLDWEAPTGGYLLTACLASGRWAGQGVLRYLTSALEGKSVLPANGLNKAPLQKG